jgi:hypothetical protein
MVLPRSEKLSTLATRLQQQSWSPGFLVADRTRLELTLVLEQARNVSRQDPVRCLRVGGAQEGAELRQQIRIAIWSRGFVLAHH